MLALTYRDIASSTAVWDGIQVGEFEEGSAVRDPVDVEIRSRPTKYGLGRHHPYVWPWLHNRFISRSNGKRGDYRPRTNGSMSSLRMVGSACAAAALRVLHGIHAPS